MKDDGFVVLDLKVEIKRVSDGKMSYDIWKNWTWYNDSYWWEEGNASCNCNRGAWFNDANKFEATERTNEDDDNSDKIECGDGGYLVRLSNANTGELLYTDMDSLA